MHGTINTKHQSDPDKLLINYVPETTKQISLEGFLDSEVLKYAFKNIQSLSMQVMKTMTINCEIKS